MSYEAPFRGLRVVDLSQGVAAPYAAMLLAQYGADVVKVEPPEGDWSRRLGVRYGDQSAFSVAANLGKRSIALDLKRDADRAIVHRLAARADVVLESFRPGVAARLGVGYDELSASNPRLLYVSVSGFGQTGPESQRPAMDPILQSFTGLIATNAGLDGIPHRVVPIVVDMGTALYTFQALSAALYARRDEARGRYLDVSLMQSAASLQTIHMMAYHLEGGRMRQGLTPGGRYVTADGAMYIVIHRDEDFGKLCDALEISSVKADARFATNDLRFEHLAVLTDLLNAAFARCTNEQLGKRLKDAGVMHSPVNTYAEFLRQPQVEVTRAVAWLEHAEVGRVPVPNVPGAAALVSGSARATAPALDQHRAEILFEMGAPTWPPNPQRSSRPG
jgi:crotonobetainyl-CoA:carnitine CoA-transferase CaiB-like acyl-CoA transferase